MCYMHLFYDLPNIQLRLDIFLRRQRAALLPLRYEDAKLYDASFQNIHEYLILPHVVPHRSMRSSLYLSLRHSAQ